MLQLLNLLLLAQTEQTSLNKCTNKIIASSNLTSIFYINEDNKINLANQYISYIITDINKDMRLHYNRSYQNHHVYNQKILTIIETQYFKTISKFFQILYPTGVWQSQSMILVVYSGDEDLEKIFQLTWKLYLLNVLVVDKFMHVYTYEPITLEKCGDFKPFLLESCENFKSFHYEAISNFTSCKFTTAFLKAVPLLINWNSSRNPGYVLDIGNELRHRLNYKLEYKDNYSEIGIMLKNGSYTQTFDDLFSGKLDYSMGIPVNGSFKKDFEFVYQYFTHNYYYWSPKAEESSTWKNLIFVFKTPVWLLLFGTYVIVNLASYILKVKEKGKYLKFAYCILKLWAAAFSAVDKFAETSLLNYLLITWVFFCLIITNAFQGSLHSILFISNFERQISDVSGILKSGLERGGSYFVKDMLQHLNSTTSRLLAKQFTVCPTRTTDCVRRVAEHGNFIAAKDIRSVTYFMRNFTDSSGRLKIFPIESGFEVYIGTYFRKGHPLIPQFKELSLRFLENGLLNHWDVKGEKIVVEKASFDVLSINHLLLAFYLLSLGLVLASLSFLGEAVNAKYFKKCENNQPRPQVK